MCKKNSHYDTKGEMSVNAYAVKPKEPFIAKGTLARTPASENNKKMIEFMNSHQFSFSVNQETKKMECTFTEK